jgi:ubiquinone/menaquinone biosynthesis C-methylase UbiE
MDEKEFDRFADEYVNLHKQNIKISGESPEFFAEYKIQDVLALAQSQGFSPQRIMDFGSGIGTSVPYFKRLFPDASLFCLDVSEKSLAVGRSRFNDAATFHAFDGKAIPFEDNSFDLIFAACVFHHIPAGEHLSLLKEWHRLLKPNGIAVIFEHNPLNPLTVHAVNTCPFDENAVLLKGDEVKNYFSTLGFSEVGLCYRLFFPGFLAKLRPLEKYLKKCPLGAQYFVHATKRPE